MRVLHLLKDGPQAVCREIVELQAAEHEVEVIDLTAAAVPYDELVDKIFASDRVICW